MNAVSLPQPPSADASKLEWALFQASLGLKMHPLHHVTESGACSCRDGHKCPPKTRGKHPLRGGWQSAATSNADQIRAMWRDAPNANPGILTGESSGVLVIDVDGDEGRTSVALLEAELGLLPATFTISTGGGGEHRYFAHVEGDKILNWVGKVGDKVDIRTERGNLVGAGANHTSGRRYTIGKLAPIATLPPRWISHLERLSEDHAKKIENDEPLPPLAMSMVHDDSVDVATREEWARAYAREIDPSISGSGGHNAAMAAATKVERGFDLPEDVAFRVLSEEWNPRCEPPWSPKDVRRKVREAKLKGRMPWGEKVRERLARAEERKRDRKARAPSPSTATDPAQADAPNDSSIVFRIGDDTELATNMLEVVKREGETIASEGELYRYDAASGLWRPIERDAQSRILQKFSGIFTLKSDGTCGKPLKVNAGNVSGAMRLAYAQVSRPTFFTDAPDGLSFANGFVRVTANVISLVPHSPEHRSRYGYDFAIDLAARAPRFERFLAELFEGAPDLRERIAALQQFFGASLIGIAPRYQRALVLLGKGANGKSTLIKIVTDAMPPGTTSAIAPQDLGQEYRRALLVGKRLNVVSELPAGDIIDGESFKALVSGDAVTARPIREAPFMFIPTAGHAFAANALPGATDTSDGFWRRFGIIRFERTFAPTEQVSDLAEQIARSERAGVITWLLLGAQAALQQGGYTAVPSAVEAVKEWRRNANPVAMFLEEKCTKVEPRMGTTATFVYDSYRRWCHGNGHHPVSSTKFGMRMRELGAASEHTSEGNRYPYAVQP